MNELSRYNLYCDESCHLQYDDSEIMCVGGIIVPERKLIDYKNHIKSIKKDNGILHELKWNTVSVTHLDLYYKLISFFFSSDMTFRSILIKNKSNISAHSMNREDYNSFYYSIIDKLLLFSINHNESRNNDFKVYLDLKDSHGAKKLQAVRKSLHQELTDGNIISKIQNIRSHESVFIQLADIIIGAITYRARGLSGSRAKSQIVKYIEEQSGYIINTATDPEDFKFSILDFQPKKRNG